jgi:hypothetical protein
MVVERGSTYYPVDKQAANNDYSIPSTLTDFLTKDQLCCNLVSLSDAMMINKGHALLR